jgi:hypothetical protein
VSLRDRPLQEKASHPEALSQLFIDAYQHIEMDSKARKAAVGCAAILGTAVVAGVALCLTRGRALPEILRGASEQEASLPEMVSSRSLYESRGFTSQSSITSRRFDFLRQEKAVDRGLPDISPVSDKATSYLTHGDRPIGMGIGAIVPVNKIPDSLSINMSVWKIILKAQDRGLPDISAAGDKATSHITDFRHQ